MNRRLLLGAVLLALTLSPGLVSAQYVWAPTDLVEWGELDSVYVAQVVTDPVNPSRVWALTANEFDPLGEEDPLPSKGIWLSTNGGSDWINKNDGNLLYETAVIDLTICRSNTDIMYAGTMSHGVYRTTNGGNSWTAANTGISHGGETFPNNKWTALAVTVEPDNPNNVYCSVAQLAGIDVFNLGPDHPGFYKSTNGGTTWSRFNSGLPSRSGMKSAVVASIVIPYQAQQYVLLGMLELELKISLFQGAKSKGRVFFSPNRASTSFTEISTGLPTVSAGSVLLGVSASGSLVYIVTSPGNPLTIMSSHLGVKGSISLLGDMEGMLASGGVYKCNTSNGQWTEKNTGLPEITDEYNDHSTNAGSIAISPVKPSILLTGIFMSDGLDPDQELDKIYLSQNGGSSWIKDWDDGMYTSEQGYRSPVPIINVFNSNMTAAYSSVHWSDSTSSGQDSGVWRLPPASDAASGQHVEPAQYGPITQEEYHAQVRRTFARLPWPINMFNRNLK